jgi:hypothetical protein
MPFAARCNKCQNFLIGEHFISIKKELIDHFLESHKNSQYADPLIVQYPTDFEHNFVEVVQNELFPFGTRCIHFLSKLFCSDDYDIAVITNSSYYDSNLIVNTSWPFEEKQEKLYSLLSDYLKKFYVP